MSRANSRKRSRRDVLRSLGTLAVATLAGGCSTLVPAQRKAYDVVVVGAGVLGIWTAYKLHMAGRRVAVVEAIGPAHSGASSGGESRVTRCGYGEREFYSEWAWRSIGDWKAISDRAGLPIFHPMGVLWVHSQPSPLVEASARAMSRMNIPFSLLPAAELRRRYPVMHVEDGEAGFLEPTAGALMARRAVQVLAEDLRARGVTFLSGEVLPIRRQQGERGALPAIATKAGERIEADQFVFACGPWLDRTCPDAMAGRLFVTRQEVFFFSVGAGATGGLPVWADLPFYGLPSLEGRGFKVANDTHGSPMNPDTTDRRASKNGEEAAREFLARRFPTLAQAPLSETRVCQYENSADGNLVIDRHPGLDNVWLAGCGSGHGFKLGPAVGSHVAELIAGTATPRDPFLLATKERRADRSVVTLQYRVSRDAYAPSQFVGLVGDGMTLGLRLAWELPTPSSAQEKAAQHAERERFDRLVEVLEARQINGIEFECQGKLEGFVLHLRTVPRLTDRGAREVESVRAGRNR